MLPSVTEAFMNAGSGVGGRYLWEVNAIRWLYLAGKAYSMLTQSTLDSLKVATFRTDYVVWQYC